MLAAVAVQYLEQHLSTQVRLVVLVVAARDVRILLLEDQRKLLQPMDFQIQAEEAEAGGTQQV